MWRGLSSARTKFLQSEKPWPDSFGSVQFPARLRTCDQVPTLAGGFPSSFCHLPMLAGGFPGSFCHVPTLAGGFPGSFCRVPTRVARILDSFRTCPRRHAHSWNANPPRKNANPHAGGMTARSRWLSAATPPDHGPRPSRTPAGLSAPSSQCEISPAPDASPQPDPPSGTGYWFLVFAWIPPLRDGLFPRWRLTLDQTGV